MLEYTSQEIEEALANTSDEGKSLKIVELRRRMVEAVCRSLFDMTPPETLEAVESYEHRAKLKEEKLRTAIDAAMQQKGEE